MKKVKIKSLPKAQLLGQLNYKPSLGLNLNANPYQNAFKPKPTLQKSLLDELTKENNSKFAVSESTQPIAKMPQLPEEWKGKSIKEIEAQVKAQKEYDALPNAIKNPDVLTADKRSDLEKFARRAWTVASSPMQSIAAVNRGGYIPSGYLGMHSAYESPNPMANVVDLVLGTPVFIANAAARQGEQLVNNPLEYGLTNTLGVFDPKMRDQAISNYLDLAAVIPAARAASPLLRNAGKSVITRTGEVKNILFEPKLTTNQASLYNREKTESLLKSLFEGKRQGWDEQYWYKQALKKRNAIKELPEYKNALEELQLADYELNEARLNNISYSMGKSNASKKDLIPYLERYNDAKAKITNIKGGSFDDVRHQYNQRVLNKYGFPLDSRSVDDAASGYFGKVIPIVGDDSKLLKIGNIMPWETQADFDLLNSIGKSAQNPSLGFPVKSHIFPNIDAQVSKMRTPGIGVHILNKVSGEPLMKYMQGPDGLKNLKTILTPEAYNTAMQNLKFLQDNNVAVDWVNPNNFMINPKTGEIGIVDLSILPKEAFTSPYDLSGVRAVSKFGVDYPALFDKAMGAFTGKYTKGASPSLQRYQRHIDQLMKNAPAYSFPSEAKASGRIWGNFDLTNPQWEIDPNNINPGGFRKGGRKKSEAGFKILTDTNGKYVFVNT